MKEELNSNNENLVTFPAAKNFPVAEGPKLEFGLETTDDPIEDLLQEIEQMELVYNNKSNKLQDSTEDDFLFDPEQEILNHRVFPKKKTLKKNIAVVKKDPHYIGTHSDLDHVLEVMRTRLSELEESQKRMRFYINEIKLNQN